MGLKLYNTWKKVKDTFAKPKLKVYFGKWRNDPNLPVWRVGPPIYFCRKKNLIRKTYILKQGVLITTGTKKLKWGDKEYEIKVREHTQHKLPGNLKSGQYMWNRDIRKKLKKWHLSWIKPVMHLPIWMRFYVVNRDVGWKTKWDDIRYEFPPQFSIIGFGLSLTFTLHEPLHTKYSSDDSYWEAILTHLYMNKSGDLKETIEQSGWWRRMDDDICYFSVRPSYINQDRIEEYYAAISEIKAQNNDKEIA